MPAHLQAKYMITRGKGTSCLDFIHSMCAAIVVIDIFFTEHWAADLPVFPRGLHEEAVSLCQEGAAHI